MRWAIVERARAVAPAAQVAAARGAPLRCHERSGDAVGARPAGRSALCCSSGSSHVADAAAGWRRASAIERRAAGRSRGAAPAARAHVRDDAGDPVAAPDAARSRWRCPSGPRSSPRARSARAPGIASRIARRRAPAGSAAAHHPAGAAAVREEAGHGVGQVAVARSAPPKVLKNCWSLSILTGVCSGPRSAMPTKPATSVRPTIELLRARVEPLDVDAGGLIGGGHGMSR